MDKSKATVKPESRNVNRLFERVKDLNKLIISRGMVLLEIIEITHNSGIILPSTVDREGYEFYKVIKTGNKDFKDLHPDSPNLDEGLTREGNIVLSMRPSMTPLLEKDGKKYMIIAEGTIISQVTSDNFSG